MGNLNKIIGTLFLLIALVTTGCYTETTIVTNTTEPNGRVVLTITDAAANMGTVTGIDMTVEKVELHSEAEGWMTASNSQHTYDLLALKASGSNALLADLSLEPRLYDQMRLEISEVIVTDNNGAHDVVMPGRSLMLNGEILVMANKTSTASFDFIADESLYTTVKGEYIFAPVVHLETRTNANVDASNSNQVVVSGGTLQTNLRVGMDVEGNLVIGGKLAPFLQIESDGRIIGTEAKLNVKSNVTYPDPINPLDLNSRIEP